MNKRAISEEADGLAEARARLAESLLAGGRAVFSPDGRNSVRLVAGVNEDGSPGDWL